MVRSDSYRIRLGQALAGQDPCLRLSSLPDLSVGMATDSCVWGDIWTRAGLTRGVLGLFCLPPGSSQHPGEEIFRTRDTENQSDKKQSEEGAIDGYPSMSMRRRPIICHSRSRPSRVPLHCKVPHSQVIILIDAHIFWVKCNSIFLHALIRVGPPCGGAEVS